MGSTAYSYADRYAGGYSQLDTGRQLNRCKDAVFLADGHAATHADGHKHA